MDIKDLEQRINELEIKFTLQEEIIETLSQITAKQQKLIDSFHQELGSHKKNAPTESLPKSLFEQLKEERPPHY